MEFLLSLFAMVTFLYFMYRLYQKVSKRRKNYNNGLMEHLMRLNLKKRDGAEKYGVSVGYLTEDAHSVRMTEDQRYKIMKFMTLVISAKPIGDDKLMDVINNDDCEIVSRLCRDGIINSANDYVKVIPCINDHIETNSRLKRLDLKKNDRVIALNNTLYRYTTKNINSVHKKLRLEEYAEVIMLLGMWMMSSSLLFFLTPSFASTITVISLIVYLIGGSLSN